MGYLSLLGKKWHVTLKVIPWLIAIILLKLMLHRLGWEFITLNALFTSLVAANTFLIGFLITGVISDYKESEKLPGELASSLEVMQDETKIIIINKGAKEAKEFLRYQADFVKSMLRWFERKEKTESVYSKLDRMNNHFAKLEPLTQANFLSRMKQEQSNVRKMLTRMHTIRDTTFIQSAYTIVEILAISLVTGLALLKMDPFYEAVFFVTLVSFLVLYMVFLIKDLDNPFEYDKYEETGTEVSLRPLHDLDARLKNWRGSRNNRN